MEENISLEEKVKSLEKRVLELEKIERNRKKKTIILIVVKILIYIILLIAVIFALMYVKETVIDPYKETIEEIEGVKDSSSNIINKYKNYIIG